MDKHGYSMALILLLSGCSLKPVLRIPGAGLPEHYPQAQVGDRDASIAQMEWTSMFPEPRLQKLIQLALDNNYDLRMAALNVDAIRAQFRIQRAARVPAIDATGNLVRQRADVNGEGISVSSQYGAGVGISAFELDLFGQAKSLSEAAFSRYLASEHGQRAARIALIGAVAESYYGEILCSEQLNLAERTLVDWRQSLDLARKLKNADQGSGLDVVQAEAQVAQAEADLEMRTRALVQARNAMRLLVGTALPPDLPPMPRLDDLSIRALPSGLPSDLLVRRPDILQAEYNLRAANADIGALRAAFFPRLSLTASTGYSSSELNRLFDGANRVWSFAPQLTLPIFNAGRLRSELRLGEIRKSSAIVEYERTVQTAFREVADALAGRETYGRQIQAQQRVVASAAKRVELSGLRYRAGLDSRLELLDAQRQWYASRQAYDDLRIAERVNAVALYKALGGGTAPVVVPGKY